MNEVIQKMSEIEISAQQIMNEAEQQKQDLIEEYKNKTVKYDQDKEKEIAEQISQIKENLEADVKSQLSGLQQQTEDDMNAIEEDFERNHEQMAQQIFQRIVDM